VITYATAMPDSNLKIRGFARQAESAPPLTPFLRRGAGEYVKAKRAGGEPALGEPALGLPTLVVAR